MKVFVAIGAGGFLGALCRYKLSLLFQQEGFPFTTLSINLIGCLCLAWLFTTFTKRTAFVTGIGTGFLGAFTTFSTFSLETLRLLQQGHAVQAICYSMISVSGGLTCAWLGTTLARRKKV
ncbi:fluoride efflux transporter CrcB [Lysinibacillus piscis]|uniref:Fluoride-specific ion channel FluC n=1 Tax=Lysinibacillus piscis TaxID=2518931 RepID=A0ABQ5NLC6_9BACI|nr:fluoride efflux transporter CrcB [Lysinibacillus sp. KH24]GLC89173.1 putative fluoride ion transporter CrcB 1 [Lysinibacillus sp. KH24]